MLKTSLPAGTYHPDKVRGAPPLAGVMIGTAISLLMWLAILTAFLAIR